MIFIALFFLVNKLPHEYNSEKIRKFLLKSFKTYIYTGIVNMNLTVIVNKTFILIYQRLFKFGLMVYVHLIGQSLQGFH